MQRYKLRLGDGTILQVDRAALGTWSMDAQAMVQTVGSQRWQPLQQFLAHERALAREVSREGGDAGEVPPNDRRPGEEEAGVVRLPARRGRSFTPAGLGEEDGLREKLLRSRATRALVDVASRFGTFLSRCVDRVGRLEERLSRDDREGFARLLHERAAGGVARLRGWVAGFTRRPSFSAPSSPPAPPDPFPASEPPPASEPASAATPPGLEPPAPLEPPPAIGTLPVLRLAPISEPVEDNDGDGGGGRDGAESIDGVVGAVRSAWPRARRFLVVAAVLAAGTWAVIAREVWVPAVTGLGRTAFTEIDGRVRARHQAQGHERALREAVQQIPHLPPETLELVLTRSPTGILGPAEVFRLACEATDRGSSSLTADERRELARLRRDLLRPLSQVERDELHDYDRARAQRASFAFEDEQALRLFARGARALPPPSLERLQELYGKAIAAALATGDVSMDETGREASR